MTMLDPSTAPTVAGPTTVRTDGRTATGAHPAPALVELDERQSAASAALVAAVPADLAIDDEDFATAAAGAARLLPSAVHDALAAFAGGSHPSGALVIRGLPVGDVPATPESPRHHTDKDRVSEFVLLTVARVLGEPVGYRPEHGGELVQNLVPTAGAAQTQTSTSSAVTLEFHTEAAFHPHKPRFLLLLGLRADPFGEARTLLCSIGAVLPLLSDRCRSVLAQPRFRTGVDASYLSTPAVGDSDDRSRLRSPLGPPVPVLTGGTDRPTLTFDADLMVGIDTEADDALQELRRAVRAHHIGVALGTGDLLVVDNHAAVHGRSPFRARYDGTDRWLQRTFVVDDLAPSAGERDGRVITTRFG